MDYQKQLDDYLMKKLAEQNDPNYGKRDRDEMARIEQNNSDNAFASSLMKSAAQMGSIGGKVADTSAVDTMAQGLGKTNQLKLGQIDDRRAREDKQFGMNADVYKYLAEKQRKTEEMANTKDYQAKTLSQNAAAAAQKRADEKMKFEADQANKNKEFGLKEKDLALRQNDSQAKLAKTGVTDGEKVLDREFAKDYNQWTSGEAKSARSEIDKLRGISSKLKSGDLTTGGLTGMFPDRITSDKVLAARSGVESSVMTSLRAILGSAFTEKEGQRIIKATWNEGDSTKNNLSRLNRLIADLENKANDKDEKANFYQAQGTLRGWKPTGERVVVEDDDVEPSSGTATAGQDKTDPKIAEYAKQYGIEYGAAQQILKQRGYTPNEQ